MVWNMNHSEWVSSGLIDKGDDVWKSPYNNDYPDDITRADGYPASGPITYFGTAGAGHWEWPMVYEFSVDLSGCGISSLQEISLNEVSAHHSPYKTGDDEEFFPGISLVKSVSIDGKDIDDPDKEWHSESPWPVLPDVLPDNFAPDFKFEVTNHGDVTLTDITVSDDVFNLDPPDYSINSLGPGQSHSFYYTDDEWQNRMNLAAGNVSFELCDDMSDWIKGDDGYFYYLDPLKPIDADSTNSPVTLCVKACLDSDLGDEYQGAKLIFNAYVEAVQYSNNAKDVVWPGHPLD